MNRNTRLVLVLAVAIVTAALASGGVYVAITRIPTKTVPVPSEMVVVAASPIEVGVSLTRDLVKTIAWPAGSKIEGAHPDIDAVLNRGLIAPVVANEPITEGKLAPLQAGAGLPPAIRKGMRAVSVAVNEVIGVAGFVVPGTYVDVLVTLDQDGQKLSRVVVPNVQVLTAGTRYDEAQAKKEGKPIPSSVVTLMVAPIDAERIALAQTEGQILLALRNPLDTDATRTPGVKRAALFENVAARPVAPLRNRAGVVRVKREDVPVVALPIPPVEAVVYTVETIKAGKREHEVLR